MTYGLYAVRDVKSHWLTPTMDVNDEVAIRNFAFAVQNPQNTSFHFAPKDFALYRVGSFDLDTGVLTPCEPQFMVEAIDAIDWKGDV